MNTDEIDDFDNDKDIQAARKIKAAHDELLNDCTSILTRELSLELAAIEPEIASFELLKSLGETIYTDFFQSPDQRSSLTVLLTEYKWSYHSTKNSGSGYDHCLLGLITFTKTFPLTFVYKETIKEKLVGLFVKGDVDFREYPKFSSSFHMVTEDEDKLRLLLYNKPLDELAAFPEMEMELRENQCLFLSARKPVDEDITRQFVALTKFLGKLFN